MDSIYIYISGKTHFYINHWQNKATKTAFKWVHTFIVHQCHIIWNLIKKIYRQKFEKSIDKKFGNRMKNSVQPKTNLALGYRIKRSQNQGDFKVIKKP